MNQPNWATLVPLVLLFAALIFTFIRLYKGPSLSDRVIALDLLSSIAIAIAAIYAIVTGHAVFLDVATVVALISFLGTIAFARYITLRDNQ